MRIRLLGTTAVLADDGSLVDVGGAKQRSLLAQLALEPNRAVSLDRLAEGIWGEAVPPRFRQNLQVYVSTLRRVLEPARSPNTPSRILGHREAYELVAAPEEIDVTRFLDAVRRGREALDRGRSETAAESLGRALGEWGGDALADLADQPFAGHWITVLDESRLAATEVKLAADLERGLSAQLVPELRSLVMEHPERERLWEYLMLALYRAGRQADALGVFREARTLLLEEVGMDPGPDLVRTADRILHQDPDLVTTPSSMAEGNAVPVPLTPLLGPGTAAGTAAELLLARKRLVVLTGPGGVGKTRSALAAAAALVDAGCVVRWVAMEATRALQEAEEAIARALSLTDLRDLSPLGGREDILVLDNLEQLDGVAGSLRRLLELVPTLQVLGTSRSRLAVPGEQLVEVAPLDVRTDAAALFVERARAVDPEFDRRADEPPVVRICEALDGVPLAIELAAARVPLFTLEHLADELTRRPEPSESRGGRQESVHDLVEWSLALLEDQTRTLFCRLCALPGGFELASAEAVGATLGLAVDEVHRALGKLLRSALLRSTETPAGRRFSMLNTVRVVGADLLTAGDEAETHVALATLWLTRATAQDVGAEPAVSEVASGIADLPATLLVLEHLRDCGELDQAALVLLARRGGLTAAGREDLVLQVGMTLLDAGLGEPLRTVVRVAAGGAAYNCFDERAEELLASVADLGDAHAQWRVLGHNWLCVLNADRGDADAALAHSEQARAAATALGNPHLLRLAHSASCWAALKRGDYASAAAHAEAQVSLVRTDTARVLALLDRCLAELHLEATDGAVRTAEQALLIARRIGPSQHLADAQQLLSWGLVQAGDPSGAVAVLLPSMRAMRSRSDPGWLLTNAAVVGLCAYLLGHVDEGRHLLELSNGLAFEIFDAPSAVPNPLLPTAALHAVPVERTASDPPVVLTVPEVVEQAIALAETLTS